MVHIFAKCKKLFANRPLAFRREAVRQMLSDFSGFGSGDALRELFHARMGMSMREFRAKARLSLP